MSEYWKSLPRKFCDICKCWFADNKASIEFHERGKRHIENAQKRIQDIQKRGIKDAKKQQQLDNDMAKIEKAALAAYKKDLQNNLEVCPNPEEAWKASNSFVEVIEPAKLAKAPSKKKKEKKLFIKKEESEKELPTIKTEELQSNETKVWYEAMTDEGHKYYWNTLDSESQWEPPEEGYVSIEDQASTSCEAKIENIKEESKADSIKEEDSDDSDNKQISSFGPQLKIDPYGNWVTIENNEPEEYDFQLPKPSEDIVEVSIPVARDEPKLRIREKVIGQLEGTDATEEVTFKKRKFNSSFKRNARQRTVDD